MRENRVVKLERALAIVDAVVSDAPGPVSVFVADTHGRGDRRRRRWTAPRPTRASTRSARPTRPPAPTRARRASSPRRCADNPVERASFDPFFTFFLGGVAVFDGDVRIGAVGVSGLPGEVDERLAIAAIERTAE